MASFYSPWLRLGNRLSRTNTAAVEMDPKFLLPPSYPGLGTRRLVLLADTQASCCSSTSLLGGLQAVTKVLSDIPMFIGLIWLGCGILITNFESPVCTKQQK